MVADGAGFLARVFAGRRIETRPPSFPLLEYLSEPRAADWLRDSMTTFAESVASILPGHFEAYARVYHPFASTTGRALGESSWRKLAAERGADLRDPAAAVAFADDGVEGAQAPVGRLPRELIEPLVEHLGAATTTVGRCFFAVWEGFGDSAVPQTLPPTLELPHRRYHVFAGPLEGAHTSFSVSTFDHLAANLWWPDDRAWCVATEVDFAWTYVGGPRSRIRAMLADSRFDAVETTATARW